MSLKLKGRILEINNRWVSAMENLRKAFFFNREGDSEEGGGKGGRERWDIQKERDREGGDFKRVHGHCERPRNLKTYIRVFGE